MLATFCILSFCTLNNSTALGLTADSPSSQSSPPLPLDPESESSQASALSASPTKEVPQYKEPRYLEVITEIPKSIGNTFLQAFDRDSLWPWVAIAATTVYTYDQDENMLLDVQREGRRLGIGNAENTKTFLEVGGLPIFRGPTDTGSALYYLGDGWVHGAISFGLIAYGESTNSVRPLATGLQLAHGMIISTLFSQAIKRSTGRESPSERTRERGTWRPFPSIAAYQADTPTYDAFPSGHVMTATVTATVLYHNYPEYRYLTVPVSALWVTLLGLQMMNNGVHWASDYPLGIGMGVFFGNMVSKMWRLDASSNSGESQQTLKQKTSYIVLPDIRRNHMGALVTWQF